ncbi:MAG: hypothetical protein LBR18_03835 [Tannerella sp.]|jgi:hypothetical protein|nr:hypothetical protein [Tannerella sp.]
MKKVVLTMVLALASLGATYGQDFYSGMTLWKARTTGMDLSLITGEKGSNALEFNLDGEGVFFLSRWFAFTGLAGIDAYKYGDADGVLGVKLGFGTRFYAAPTGFYVGLGIDGYKKGDADIYSNLKLEAGYTIFVLEHVFLEPALHASKAYYFDEGKFGKSLRLGASFGIGVEF